MRSTLASLDDVEEGSTYGNPTFKVSGKAFAVLDLYQGQDCLWTLVDPTERGDRLQQAGWSASPYDPRKSAPCCDLDAIDWRRAKGYLRSAYQLAKAAAKPKPRLRK